MDIINIVGLILVSLSGLFMFLCIFHKNDSFFNLRKTFKDHFCLFKECPKQYIIFYILPLIFSIGLAMLYKANEVFYTNLSVIISILLSMLLAILSILSGKEYNDLADNNQSEKVKKVTNETITAINFDVLLCIFLLLFGLVMVVIYGVNLDLSLLRLSPNAIEPIVDLLKRVFSGITYYSFSIILLTLLLIVKRMSKIIDFNLKAKRRDK